MSDKNHLNFAQKSNCGEGNTNQGEDFHLLNKTIDIIVINLKTMNL